MAKDFEPIYPLEIVIARRWSKLEWAMHTTGLTQEEWLDHYERMGLKERQWGSHLAQMKSVEMLRRVLSVSRADRNVQRTCLPAPPGATPQPRRRAPRRRPRTAAAWPGGRRERRVQTLWTASALWHTRRRCRGLLVQREGERDFVPLLLGRPG